MLKSGWSFFGAFFDDVSLAFIHVHRFYEAMLKSSSGSMNRLNTLVFTVLVFLSLTSLVIGVDHHKFKKCSDSSFCRRHRNLDGNNSPFKYSIDESSISVEGNLFKSVVREEKSQIEFSLEMKLFESSIVRLQLDEKNPLTEYRRYRVSDVVEESNLQKSDWSSFENSTLNFESGKVVIDPKNFKFDFYHHGNPSVTLNQRGLFYFEHLRPKPEVKAQQRDILENNDQNDENQQNSVESDQNGDVIYGPDGNPIIGAKPGHVGAVNRDLHSVDDEHLKTMNLVHDEHRHGQSVDNVDDHKIDMEGAWEERFGGTTDPKKRGPESLGLDFTFHGSKHVYGLPEHAIALDLPATKGLKHDNGESITRDPYRLYNLDVFEYELDSEMALYGAVPLLYAHDETKTTAVFWLNAAETWVDIEKPKVDFIQGGVIGKVLDALSSDSGPHSEAKNQVHSHFMSESGILDVFIILGNNPKEVLEKYKLLTGPAQLPPLPSIAYHQCRWNYKDIDDVLAVNEGFEKHGIPMDYIWLDIEHTDGKRYFTWDPTHFNDPISMLKKIEDSGRKMVTIIDPHIKRDGDYQVHNKATENGFYVKNAHGSDYDGHCWSGSSSYLDFLNPKVRSWWADLYDYETYKGSASNLFTWNDMNEPSVFNGPEVTMPKDNIHFGDVEHRHIHNQYGFYMHLATAEGQERRSLPKGGSKFERKRPFVLTRSFFAGSQRNGAVWTGDNLASWEHLQASLPMIMSLGLGGITFSGADVGGFFKDPSPELMARWYQAGAWYPFFRSHAHIDAKRREPWIFNEPHFSVIRDAVRMRYSLLPYWYTQFYQAHKHLTPVMRPLFVEYPKDTLTFAMEDQFLIGSDILVHPVTQEGQSTVDVYLPGDLNQVWYDYTSHKAYHAGRTINVATPLDYTPVFVRGGSIIPTKDRLRRSTTQMKNDPYSLLVALDENSNAIGTIYIDDGETFQFEDNQWELLEFIYNAKSKTYHSFTVTKSTDSGKLALENTLNRVTIVGIETAPSKVILNVDGHNRDIEFDFNPHKHELTLRNPKQIINSDWTFEITW